MPDIINPSKEKFVETFNSVFRPRRTFNIAPVNL